MDIATLIGIVVGLGAIGGSIFLAAAEAGASTAGFVSVSYTHLTLPTKA